MKFEGFGANRYRENHQLPMRRAILSWLDSHSTVLFLWEVVRVPACQLAVLLFVAWLIRRLAVQSFPDFAIEGMEIAKSLRRASLLSYAVLIAALCLVVGNGLGWSWAPSELSTIRFARDSNTFVLLAMLCDVALAAVTVSLMRIPADSIARSKLTPDTNRGGLTLALTALIVAANLLIQRFGAAHDLGGDTAPATLVPTAARWMSNVWLLWTFTVVPVTEEFVFRGAVFATLERLANRSVALVVSSTAFALMHASLQQFAFILGVGLALGLLRLVSRSLGAPIAAHMIINITAYIGVA